MSTPIQLYAYDLSGGMARMMSMQLTGTQIDGIWHTSIVVYGKEVYYAQGIEICRPGGSHHGQPLQIFDLGTTEIDEGTFDEYIDELRGHYTAEKYHLLEFNCNSFTNDVIGFLNGGSIPPHIKDLPATFLSTPFGQSLRPTIDAMYRRPAPGTPSPLPPTGITPGLATSILQGVATQAAQGGTPAASSTSTLTSHLHISTNLASFRDILSKHKAAVVYLPAGSAVGDNAGLGTAFEKLARDVAAEKTTVAFVKVERSVGTAEEIVRELGVGADSTVVLYQGQQKVSTLTKPTPSELGSKVQAHLKQVFPAHPHLALNLPTIRSLALSPILHTTPPSNLTAPITKVTESISALIATATTASPGAESQPNASLKPLKLAKSIFTASFSPFITKQFASSNANTTPSKLADNAVATWTTMTRTLFSSTSTGLPLNDTFPLVDLWRLAILDSRVASSPSGRDAVQIILTRVQGLIDAGESHVPKALLLTALRLCANLFAHPASLFFAVTNGGEEGEGLKGRVTALTVHALLHEDVSVRTAGASVAFNLARDAGVRNRGVEGSGVSPSPTASNAEGAEVEMICGVLEALERERGSEGIIHRLAATLSLYLYLSPSLVPATSSSGDGNGDDGEDLGSLLEVLGAKDKVLSKLADGALESGGGKIQNEEVRKLVAEVGELCP